MTAFSSRRDLLPPHGTMTREELHGFRIACACMATWGQQLANSLPEVSREGRFLHAAALALDKNLGQGQIPAPAASLMPEGFTG